MTSNQILRLYKKAVRITKWSDEAYDWFYNWHLQEDRLAVVDTETTGVIFHEPTILKHGRLELSCPGPVIFGISLCLPIDDELVLVWARMETKLYDEVVKLLNYASIKVAHNARYDIRMFQEENIKIAGQIECTQTMSRIIYDRRMKHSLQSLVEMWCPELSDWEVAVKREMTRLKTASTRAGHPPGYVNYSFIDDKLMAPYSMMDSFMCYIGYRILQSTIKETFTDVYERERKVYYGIIKVEQKGIAFNYRKARKSAEHLQSLSITELTKVKRIVKDNEFNPNSPAQVLRALHSLKVKDKDLTYKGKVTTGADILRELQGKTKDKKVINFINSLLLYRAYVKTIGTYLLPLAQQAESNHGIVYTSINPAETRTGRMAARDPNLQNIPTLNPRRGRTAGGENPVRSCFICRPNCATYYFDFSQMEIVLFGAYTDTRIILDTYAAGEDVHGVMAAELYGTDYDKIQRDRTKDTNYGIIYGMGIQGMAKYRAVSLAKAQQFLNFYFNTFDSIKRFQDECENLLLSTGYVEDWFGKQYHLPSGEAYKAVNAVVQGGCAQIFKIGFLQTKDFLSTLKWPAYIILPAHDEFQIESKIMPRIDERYFCKHVVEQMTKIPQLTDRGLHLRVDVKKSISNWAEKVEVKF